MLLRDQKVVMIYHLFAICVVALDADIFSKSLFIWHAFNFEGCSVADYEIFTSIIGLAKFLLQRALINFAGVIALISPKSGHISRDDLVLVRVLLESLLINVRSSRFKDGSAP